MSFIYSVTRLLKGFVKATPIAVKQEKKINQNAGASFVPKQSVKNEAIKGVVPPKSACPIVTLMAVPVYRQVVGNS